MLSPEKILSWLEGNVKGMRRSRLKSIAAIVPAAMQLCGIGVLALGRAMQTGTSAKHNIKRVARFLDNDAVEGMALARAIVEAFAPPPGVAMQVVVDWTDVPNAKLLVFALPCNGRSLPFFVRVAPKNAGEGGLIQAEDEGLRALRAIVGKDREVIVIADRGFGNQRWIGAVRAQGFHFVQRFSCVFNVDTEHYIGALRELNVRRGKRIRDWGHGTIGEEEAIEARLVTAYDPEAKEPWYLGTDLEEIPEDDVVDFYRRRWWIEPSFRDNKNRDWGLGLAHVHLKEYRRYERLFYIVALAFIFLSAHGALAEAEGFDKGLKANTRKTRVLNLLRMGYHFIRSVRQDCDAAVVVLRQLVQKNHAPNWG
jgi:hypothetical protein